MDRHLQPSGTSVYSLVYEGIKMEDILIAGRRPTHAMWCHMEPAHPTPFQPQA